MSLKEQLLEKLIESLHSMPEKSDKRDDGLESMKDMKTEDDSEEEDPSVEITVLDHNHEDDEPCSQDCPAHKMDKEELG